MEPRSHSSPFSVRPDRFKAQQLRLNGLPCPEGERLGQSDYYRAITTQYRVLFAPGGRGAAEHKFWEAWLSQCSSPSPCVPSSCTIIQAAAAGTVILTDYTSSQYELLRGLPAIMVEPGAYSRVTPALLERLVGQIARSPTRCDVRHERPSAKRRNSRRPGIRAGTTR